MDRPLEDWEYPDPEEADEEDLETLPCPACGEQIYEEASRCPYCGEYAIHGTSVFSGRPVWYVLLALLGVVAVIVVLTRL